MKRLEKKHLSLLGQTGWLEERGMLMPNLKSQWEDYCPKLKEASFWKWKGQNKIKKSVFHFNTRALLRRSWVSQVSSALLESLSPELKLFIFLFRGPLLFKRNDILPMEAHKRKRHSKTVLPFCGNMNLCRSHNSPQKPNVFGICNIRISILQF